MNYSDYKYYIAENQRVDYYNDRLQRTTKCYKILQFIYIYYIYTTKTTFVVTVGRSPENIITYPSTLYKIVANVVGVALQICPIK